MHTQEIAYKYDGEWRLRTINSKGVKEINITKMETALRKIANSHNYDFNNWKQRGDKMQQIAKEALGIIEKKGKTK